MARGGPLNYTTKIAASRTAGECQQILANAGAASAAIIYADRKPAGLSFRLDAGHGLRDFTMPVNVAGVHKMLIKAVDDGLRTPHVRPGMLTSAEHAANVAWRVIKDWLEAQLALIDAHMATLDEVMLPYLQVDPQRTLYQAYQEREQLALEAGDHA
jgi:hypothetical protein